MTLDAGGLLPIALLKDDARSCWQNAPASFPRAATSYSEFDQAAKEADVDRRMEEAEREAGESLPAPRQQAAALTAVHSRLRQSIVQFLHTFDCDIGDEMERDFSNATDDFIRQAYAFNPAADEEDVYQASRNVMIMNTFQMRMGMDVRLTPSVFAYSMLYPVTDNYLDDARIKSAAKREANDRLTLRLLGLGARPRNRHERTIDALVGMIEEEYDRNAFPQVYESLLAIHRAQIRSVGQQNREPGSDELLDISVEKGGTSVLADGYLAGGTLSRADEQFVFRFGVLLQLIDDLQDIREDGVRGHRTLALQAAASGSLELFTNRLLSFIDAVVDPGAGDELHRLIGRSCRLLILEAVASTPALYTDCYLRMLERHTPVRFPYLRAMKSRLRDCRNRHGRAAARYGACRTVDRTAA